MKEHIKGSGPNAALMNLYAETIADLNAFLETIPENQFKQPLSGFEEFTSVDNVVVHIISSGYTYANNYRRRFNETCTAKKFHSVSSRSNAIECINDMFRYTLDSLHNKWEMTDDEMMRMLIKTNWSIYDLEAIWEHAIVHILRHKKQIKKMLLALPEKLSQNSSDTGLG